MTLVLHGPSFNPLLPVITPETLATSINTELTAFWMPLNYTAGAGMVMRSAQNRAADIIQVRDFGAVFDGASHPLSAYYPTLLAVQVVYPHAVS